MNKVDYIIEIRLGLGLVLVKYLRSSFVDLVR